MTDQPTVAEKVNGVETPAIYVEKITDVDAVQPHDEDVPTFDFGELSYDDFHHMQRTQIKAQRMVEDGMTEDEAAPLVAIVFNTLALTITYMPRSWLVRRAPADLDITQEGMLTKYIRANRMEDLMAAFRDVLEKKASKKAS